MEQVNNKIEIEILVQEIIKLQKDESKTLECEFATPKMMRQLYKALGDPNPKDYDGVGEFLWRVNRMQGYTKYPQILTVRQMECRNCAEDYRIKRPSETKKRIVEDYKKHGWGVDVQAYNVLCEKFMPHKDYKNIWIRFISTRDCAKYEYVLVEE